jgi:hypothetical protein
MRCRAHPLLILILGLVACSDPPPAKSPASKNNETVPANSLSDARLKGEEDPKDRAEREAAKKGEGGSSDPSKPYTTKVGESETTPSTSSSPSSPSSSDPKKAPPAAKGAVSKSECDRVMDKYLELEIASNPQLKGVPPDVIEAAKQMAREKHGDVPCTASKAQVTCAMAATSVASWQKCMK